MPIEFTPPRRLLTQLQHPRAPRRAEDLGAPTHQDGETTEEVITAVLGEGRYEVAGAVLTTTGVSQDLRAGTLVPVAWKGGTPVAILSHTARRAQFGPSGVPALGGVVEVLYLAAPPGTPSGRAEVWFRDDSRMVRLLAASEVVANAVSTIRWGLGSADYFCTFSEAGRDYVVYRLNRPTPNEPFPRGVTPKATLVRRYQFSVPPLSTVTFGSVSVANSLGPLAAAGPLTYNTVIVAGYVTPFPTIGVQVLTTVLAYGGITPDGELVVINKLVGNGDGGSTGGGYNVTHLSGDLIINAATGGVLVNRLASGSFTVFGSSGLPTGIASVTYTPSIAAAQAGRTTVLSLKKDRASGAISVNNFVLASPAFDDGGGIGGASVGARALSVVGEFPMAIGALSTTPVIYDFLFQASRTRGVWAGIGGSGFVTSLTMVDFRHQTTGILAAAGGIPAGFFTAPPTTRPLYCTQADLIYHPVDDVAPFDRQFFVAGANPTTGAIAITLAALTRLTALAQQAHLVKLSAARHTLITTDLVESDLQVVNSRRLLGGRASAGSVL